MTGRKTGFAVKARLSVMSALVFAVWGAYLTSMSNYMGSAHLGMLIPWYFAIQGLVCLITPPIAGIIADKYVQPRTVLSLCQLGASISMGVCWYLGWKDAYPSPWLFTTFFTISSAFFVPSVALSNSIAFRTLRKENLDTEKHFPQIRVFGTIGFIAAMLFVNCASFDDGTLRFGFYGINRFQYQCWQFLVSAILSFILFLYSMSLPSVQIDKSRISSSLYDKLGLNALGILKSRQILLFFIFSMLMGMCVKVTNGYSGPFITGFMAYPEYASSFGAGNATLLTSISQASEALCILLIPFFLKKYGIKVVLSISFFAWALRFGTFAFGNPGSGLWLLVASMLIYGVAFDFFSIAGAIYLENVTDKRITASAQGLWMMMTNGIGASVGTIIAGYIIEAFCHWQPLASNPKIQCLVGDWEGAWLVFAGFALVVGLLFIFLFKTTRK